MATVVFSPGLDCTSDETLVSSYRSRFFVRVAFAEAPALGGFAAFVVAGEPWLYLLGFAFAGLLLAAAAPSRRHLERDQEQLQAGGCGRALSAALNQVGANPS